MEAYQVELSQFDRCRGTAYFVHSKGQVMRAGRERVQLLSEGFYKTDMKRQTTDKLDAYVPIRTLH
jgi:hypothetical protein